MPDKREQIMVRLVEIATALPGINTVLRNSPLQDDTMFPCVQILDADESPVEFDLRPDGRRATKAGVFRVQMTPEVYITLSEKAEQIGTDINAMRAAWLKAVVEDAQLEELLGTNGAIEYGGSATGLARGRGLIAELGVSIAFTYILRVADL